MIHDGARPIVDRGMIRNLYNMLALVDRVHAAVPCYAPTEALAQMEMVLLEPVSRDRFVSVQTPQTFDATLLIECYDKLRSAGEVCTTTMPQSLPPFPVSPYIATKATGIISR